MKPDSQMTLDRYFRQCVGIDVSKDKFTACLQMYDRANDVGCHTMSIDFDNTKSGFNQFVKWSRKEAVKGFPLTSKKFKDSCGLENVGVIEIEKVGEAPNIKRMRTLVPMDTWRQQNPIT